MRSSRSRCACLLVLGVLGCAATTGHAQLWRNFLPSGGESNDKRPDTHLPMAADGTLGLTQNSGPWLIVAASFSGEGAEEQAEGLASELRTRFRLRSYVHEMSFKLGDESPGRGLDEYGAPVRRRFRRGNEIHELAVLIGDFQSIDDPEAQKTLDRVKTLQPNALNVATEETTQTMAHVRRLEDALMEKLGKPRKRGPMSQAFFTRNPILPREYFVPKGVDAFVAKMNDGVEHGLLDCPGKYTVRVATFRGKTILQTSANDSQESKSFWGRRKADDDNPLVEAAENAHLLTQELRAHGWEAYEFHDRTESYVTIGSLAQVAQQLPDGRVIAVPAVDRIVRTFGAAYDTPADPLTKIGNDPTTQRLVDQQEQEFNMRISSQQGQIVPGLNPKHIKIFNGSGKRRRLDRIIPIDVYPEAIEAPKRSISSAYAD